jgi:hypothetical protein
VTVEEQLAVVLQRFAAASLVAAPLFTDEARTHYVGFFELTDGVTAVVHMARQHASASSEQAVRLGAVSAARTLASLTLSSIRRSADDTQASWVFAFLSQFF